jgi:3-hydroxymyristoyl/3-hydroxydecanoyl-(acyl carrier protein) dehydratase
MLEEFASGRPSKVFGESYTIFDRDRFLARLPRPPYLFMDRVIKVQPEPWVLKPDGWIESETDIKPDAWFFGANRIPMMPFCVLNEIALQPCGWLAAYMGSALKSRYDLRFRNLGGDAVILGDIHPETTTLQTRARLKQVSQAGDMIIEEFDFEVLQSQEIVYRGHTYFGFFTEKALSQQIGLKDPDLSGFGLSMEDPAQGKYRVLPDYAPFIPQDANKNLLRKMGMPAKALRMIDRIDNYIPDGGPHGMGYLSATKHVDPQEWFFKAHFYQDPVCPGSLGLESVMQALKYIALERWGHLTEDHCFSHVTDVNHQWLYRGQIIPHNKKVQLKLVVKESNEEPCPFLCADALLKVDGRYIYKMDNFTLKIT